MHLVQVPIAACVFANSFSFPSEYVLFMYVKEQHTAQKNLAFSLLSYNRKKQGHAADYLFHSEWLYMLILWAGNEDWNVLAFLTHMIRWSVIILCCILFWGSITWEKKKKTSFHIFPRWLLPETCRNFTIKLTLETFIFCCFFFYFVKFAFGFLIEAEFFYFKPSCNFAATITKKQVTLALFHSVCNFVQQVHLTWKQYLDQQTNE